MTPELQTVVDRLEMVERQNRSLKLGSGLALLLSLAAIGLVAWQRFAAPEAPTGRGRFSVIEANRILLRDLNGRTAGGMEADRSGSIRLVLGTTDGRSGAAFLEVQPDGLPNLTLRGPDGGARVTLLGTRLPSLLLAPEGMGPTTRLTTSEDGTGAIVLTDANGRTRFHAP